MPATAAYVSRLECTNRVVARESAPGRQVWLRKTDVVLLSLPVVGAR